MQERFRKARKRLETTDEITEPEREHILEFIAANNPRRNTYQMPDGATKSDSTLARYCNAIRIVASDLESDLTDTTPDEINRLMDDYMMGEVGNGISSSTARNRQGPMRRFYLYHDDLGVDRDDIIMVDQQESTIDERDLFNGDEIQALRDEAKRRGSRDSALIDLLIYTGQRRSAILNLRLKDVRPDEGIFYLNEDDGDLKGAQGKRPLLGARKSVREWKRQHPTGDPEDYLITHKHSQTNREGTIVGEKLDASTVYRQLKRIGDAAGVEKPVNAHNFRHVFVTIARRDYNMDMDTIRHLIGHAPDSRVMETTYAHLTDEDYIRDAEIATGIREPEDDSPLTPATCDNCAEPLDKEWESCPYCGYVYTPDAYQTKEDIDDDMFEGMREADSDDEKDAVETLRDYLDDNPEVLAELLDD